MPQYLVANYLPDDFDPSTVTEAMIEEIHALNREMIAAGVRKFACGISAPANAKTNKCALPRATSSADAPIADRSAPIFIVFATTNMAISVVTTQRGKASVRFLACRCVR